MSHYHQDETKRLRGPELTRDTILGAALRRALGRPAGLRLATEDETEDADRGCAHGGSAIDGYGRCAYCGTRRRAAGRAAALRALDAIFGR